MMTHLSTPAIMNTSSLTMRPRYDHRATDGSTDLAGALTPDSGSPATLPIKLTGDETGKEKRAVSENPFTQNS